MKTRMVRIVGVVCATGIIALAMACGSDTTSTEGVIPGGGIELPLVRVDGNALPVTVGPSGDQRTVVSGKAGLGEAIQSGSFEIVMSRQVGASTETSTLSGSTIFSFSEQGPISATIDLGGTAGSHIFVFSR